MVGTSDLTLRAKIRARLCTIEKSLVRFLGEDRVTRLKESIHRRLEMEPGYARKSGIARPTLSTKGLFRD
jgi:hypothetical protein